jgi:hypothetical protein
MSQVGLSDLDLLSQACPMTEIERFRIRCVLYKTENGRHNKLKLNFTLSFFSRVFVILNNGLLTN